LIPVSRACVRSVSRAENGAERTENRLERSGAVSGVQKIKWNVSGAGAGGRRSGNGAVSGQNLPLKIRSTIEPLKENKLKIDFKSYHETVSENIHCYFVCCIENKSGGV